jgi:hypothetical protein
MDSDTNERHSSTKHPPSRRAGGVKVKNIPPAPFKGGVSNL